MTVLRLGDGQLVLHSPIPISAALHDELAALGPVGFVVVPNAHGKFARAAAKRFATAKVLAAPTLPRDQRSLAVHGSLADQPPPAWAGQIETHLLHGFRLNEVVLFQRATRTLVITDLCFNIQRSESAVARAFFRANGMWRRFGPSRIIRALAVSDRAALERSLERVLEWDFTRIIPGHGDLIERDAPAALRAAWPR